MAIKKGDVITAHGSSDQFTAGCDYEVVGTSRGNPQVYDDNGEKIVVQIPFDELRGISFKVKK